MQCPKPVDSRESGNPVILPELIETLPLYRGLPFFLFHYEHNLAFVIQILYIRTFCEKGYHNFNMR